MERIITKSELVSILDDDCEIDSALLRRWRFGSTCQEQEEAHQRPRSFIHSFTECYSKPFNDPVVQAFITFDQWLRPSDSDELAEHMNGDSDIKFLLSHYVDFFQGDEVEGHRSFEGHHHKEQDTGLMQ